LKIFENVSLNTDIQLLQTKKLYFGCYYVLENSMPLETISFLGKTGLILTFVKMVRKENNLKLKILIGTFF